MEHVQKLIARVQFAALCHVSPAAITKACKGPLGVACVGIRIDAAHVVAVKYAAKHAAATPRKSKPSGKAAVRAGKKSGGVDDEPYEVPKDIPGFLDMTLRELIAGYGTDVRFVDWLAATVKIENIREKQLKNATREGKLVARSLIQAGIIDPYESAHVRILTGAARTIAIRVHAMAKAGRPVADCEALIVDQISSYLEPVKGKVKRTLSRRGG